MKALTLTQPWATLVAYDYKQFETRSWQTSYRGQVAIHAAKGFPKHARRVCELAPFKEFLTVCGYSEASQLPTGVIVAITNLVDIQPVETVREEIGRFEFAFGDYSDGRFAWKLKYVMRLQEPISAKGALGLWEWEPPADFVQSL